MRAVGIILACLGWLVMRTRAEAIPFLFFSDPVDGEIASGVTVDVPEPDTAETFTRVSDNAESVLRGPLLGQGVVKTQIQEYTINEFLNLIDTGVIDGRDVHWEVLNEYADKEALEAFKYEYVNVKPHEVYVETPVPLRNLNSSELYNKEREILDDDSLEILLKNEEHLTMNPEVQTSVAGSDLFVTNLPLEEFSDLPGGSLNTGEPVSNPERAETVKRYTLNNYKQVS